MITLKTKFTRQLPWALATSICLATVHAQTTDLPPLAQPLPQAEGDGPSEPSAELVNPQTAAAPSQNAMVNLLRLLEMKGSITKAESQALIVQAEQDAANARAEAAAAATADPLGENDMSVPYIPESVRERIRDEIKDDVLAAAKTENWTGAGKVPEWIDRWKPFGDIRLRYEINSYPVGNDNTGAFPNFNAINTGSPFDTAGTVFSPQYNVDADRQRMRLRARMGTELDLGEGFTGGLRFGTGENNSPVTTNQSLGLASQGQGGNFSKYAIWLDRAFMKWELGDVPNKELAVFFGRFDNPYFCSDVLFDEDIGFDGLALQGKYEIAPGFTPFVTGSLSPVFNNDMNFSSNQPSKFKSTDKWLYAAQAGFDWQITKKVDAKVSAAYYHFQGVEGKLSDPYLPLSASDAGNTDNTRPSFAQRGNTYMALRNIVPSPLNNFGTTNQYQYFGLATPFQVLSITGKLDFNNFEPCQISLKGEFLKNLAYDQEKINAVAVNNRGPNPAPPTVEVTTTAPDGTTATTTTADTTPKTTPTEVGPYEGGDTAWMVQLQIGKPSFQKRGDWSAFLGYRYVESDAVIDGFTDSEFAGGGTNAKGFVVGGSIALSKRVKLGLQWMSAEQIAGPPLKSDTFFIDISTKF
jgi:hypothetical protein